MAAVPNTVRRTGIYHFRRAVPAGLRPVLKRAELSRSLQTADAALARVRSCSLYLAAESLFEAARSLPVLTETKIASLVRDFYDTELAEENTIRLRGRPVFDEANRAAIVEWWDRQSNLARNALAMNELHLADEITRGLLHKHGLAGQVDELETARLQQAVLRALAELSEALKARFHGDFNYEPKDVLLVRPAAPTGPASPAATLIDASQAVDEHPSGPPFVKRAEEFRQAQVRRKLWERQTALQARKSYEMFAELCGDRPLSGYLRQDAVRFKDMMSDLPADYGKSVAYRGMTGAEIVAATVDKDVPRVTSRTVQRHVNALSALWRVALERGEVNSNIFAGFKFASAKRAQDQRSMWSSDQLAKLFSSPIWAGCRSEARRSTPGGLIIRDEKFWLPLVAVFSGMRQEEICQLHLEDVRQESGVWVFDVNARPPRQLKNTNAVRLVPIHEKLVRLGFLTYVEEQRGARHQLAFHQLTRGGADQRLGHNFTKWFTRYRRDVGLYEKGLDFHSLRHSATTFMQWSEVPLSIIDNLTGHATAGETARYTKSFKIHQLQAGIDAIDPQVDLTHLYLS